MEKLSKEQKLV